MFLMGNKQYVILRPYKAFNWLLVEIIDKIRAKYGVSFIVLVPPGYSVQRAFSDKITEDDLIIEMPDISSFFSEETARDEVFDISRRNEKKYDLLYYRDVLQQERSLVPLVMPNSHGYSIKQIEHLTDQQICNAINHFFLF